MVFYHCGFLAREVFYRPRWSWPALSGSRQPFRALSGASRPCPGLIGLTAGEFLLMSLLLIAFHMLFRLLIMFQYLSMSSQGFLLFMVAVCFLSCRLALNATSGD